MRNYGQFCPIARASEVLDDDDLDHRRNLLIGCRTFNETRRERQVSTAAS